MTTDLESLQDLLGRGSTFFKKQQMDEIREKEEEHKQLMAAWDEIKPKIIKAIPENLLAFLRIQDNDIRDLVLKGRSSGMRFEVEGLFPIYLVVNANGKSPFSIEYHVPALLSTPVGFAPAITGQGRVWNDEHWLAFEDPALAIYQAKRRFDLMQELQAKFDDERKQPVYTQVEETQGTQSSEVGITIHGSTLEKYIDDRIRLVTQYLGQ